MEKPGAMNFRRGGFLEENLIFSGDSSRNIMRRLLTSYTVEFTPDYYFRIYDNGSKHRPLCPNGTIRTDYNMTVVVGAANHDSKITEHTFPIFRKRDGSHLKDTLEITKNCWATEFPVHRLIDARTSTVQIETGLNESVNLSVDLPMFQRKVSEKSVALSVQNDNLYVSWLQYGNEVVAEASLWEGQEAYSSDRLVLKSFVTEPSSSLDLASLNNSPLIAHREEQRSTLYALTSGNWFRLREDEAGTQLNSAIVDLEDRKVLSRYPPLQQFRPLFIHHPGNLCRAGTIFLTANRNG